MGAYPAYKKDYDAMVFIDGWDVVAINSDGSVIDHGTNWVDDSDVIQSAIDYVVSATGGGKISIGAGVFVIYTPILVKSYIQLCGEGTTTTLYAETGLDDDVIYIEDQTNCLIDNLWIAGNSAGQASGSGIYINHTASTDCFNVVKDVVITDCKEYGVEISANSDYVSVLNNIIGGCGTAPVSDPTLTSVIRDTYGHTSIQSRRDYDAMVFIEGTSVIAVDSNGVCIARGVAGTDDATVIQAAIDSLAVSGGHIFVAGGEYVCSSQLLITTDDISISGDGPNTYIRRADNYDYANQTMIRVENCNNVSLKNLDVFGALSFAYAAGAYYKGVHVENVNIRGSPRFGFYLYANPNRTVEDIYISNVRIDSPAGMGVWLGASNSIIRNVHIENVKVYNVGNISGYTGITDRSQYTTGFDINEGNELHRCTLVSCHAEGCWESGFHQEHYPADETTGISYINCTSKDNGQKTKTSSGIVYYNDLTQSTPFDCTFVGKTHQAVRALRCRLQSDTDSITAFSIRFQGFDSGDNPIDETITEATPGVVNVGGSWSFYTAATWKAWTYPTSITVQSVTGASVGDTICVGQDATYGAGFLASNATYFGCKSEDEIYGFKIQHTNAVLVGCSDNNSETPISSASGSSNKIIGFTKYTNMVPQQNRTTLYVGSRNSDYPIVDDGYFSTVAAALASITDNAADKQYTIVLQNDVTDTSLITWKNYVNLIGNGFTWTIDTNSNGTVISIEDGSGIRISDVNVVKTGTSTSYPISYVLEIFGASDDSVRIYNSSFVNSSTGTYYVRAISISDASCPIISGCRFVAGNTHNDCNAGNFNNNSERPAKITDCTFVGGDGGPRCDALRHAGNCDLINCTLIPGSLGGNAVQFAGLYPNVIIGCTFINPKISGGGIDITSSGSVKIQNCVCIPYDYTGLFEYEGSGYSILPFSSHPYYISGILVYVSVAGAPGSTIEIGTSDGGNEIGSVSSASTGFKYFAWNNESLIADAPFYVKPTDTSTRFYCRYTVVYNNVTRGISLLSELFGSPRISNSKFYTNKVSEAGYISTNARTRGRFLIENCSFESAGTYDLAGQTSGVVPVYNCTFGRGSLHNILLPGKGTTATISAGDTYVDVTHNLNNTPTTVRVTPTTNLGTRSFWVSDKGASTFRININSSDSIDHTFDWEAEV